MVRDGDMAGMCEAGMIWKGALCVGVRDQVVERDALTLSLMLSF